MEKRGYKQTPSDGLLSHVTQIGRKFFAAFIHPHKHDSKENNHNSIWALSPQLETEFNIADTIELTQHLSLHLPLTSPLISPTLKSKALDISHRLRLRLYFELEKEMALSFPLIITTAPVQDASSSTPPSSPISLNEEGWLRGLVTDLDVGIYPPSSEQLPSYDDVLSEGLPPLVFIDSLNSPLYT